jgi:hypothetical protein
MPHPLVRRVAIDEHHERFGMARSRSREPGRVPVRRERNHTEDVGVSLHHAERAPSDRTGTTEYRDA